MIHRGEAGTPYVIVTNGDRYAFYDRTEGMSYEDYLSWELQLTSWTV